MGKKECEETNKKITASKLSSEAKSSGSDPPGSSVKSKQSSNLEHSGYVYPEGSRVLVQTEVRICHAISDHIIKDCTGCPDDLKTDLQSKKLANSDNRKKNPPGLIEARTAFYDRIWSEIQNMNAKLHKNG